uniref:Cilia- and flagella-associated protein 418 n=1 Tax=Noctiluca scintillans TaxID=2966 RepID=A0A7S1AMK6_NOCSC|mmetsp:Transcript_5163/g.14498  ORF Transcript_5163/g.14498 Transcript_5163/m.14498 type:complete len:590 (+) Transcript_5163:97-1866(+)
MTGDEAMSDARSLTLGTYSAWLTKVKGNGAKAKWFSTSSKRYFTIDYNIQIFYYSHTSDKKETSNPIKFCNLLGAEMLPRPATPAKRQDTFGFVVKVQERSYELYTSSYRDAELWVDGLNAARDMCVVKKREEDVSVESTTDGGSNGGRCEDTEARSVAGQAPHTPFSPPLTSGSQSLVLPSSQPWMSHARSQPPLPSLVTGPPPESVDPFEALDALEQLAGPPPEQGPVATAAAQGELLRQARRRVTQPHASRTSVASVSADAEERRALTMEVPAREPRSVQDACEALSRKTLEPVATPLLLPPPPVVPVPSSMLPTPSAPESQASLGARALLTKHNPDAEAWDSEEDVPLNTPPGALQAALTSHNPNAETWDSDGDDDAVAPPTQREAESAALAAVTAHNPHAETWDSDDEGSENGVPDPQPSVTADPEDSDWDAPVRRRTQAPKGSKAPKVSKARRTSQSDREVEETARDSCGGKAREGGLVTARTKGDDLDALVGELMATSFGDMVTNFHCTACDHQVFRILDHAWNDEVDYMFFRNNYPTKKLRKHLEQRTGCCAFCCQCAWKSAERDADLQDVAAGLRWKLVR